MLPGEGDLVLAEVAVLSRGQCQRAGVNSQVQPQYVEEDVPQSCKGHLGGLP